MNYHFNPTIYSIIVTIVALYALFRWYCKYNDSNFWCDQDVAQRARLLDARIDYSIKLCQIQDDFNKLKKDVVEAEKKNVWKQRYQAVFADREVQFAVIEAYKEELEKVKAKLSRKPKKVN